MRDVVILLLDDFFQNFSLWSVKFIFEKSFDFPNFCSVDTFIKLARSKTIWDRSNIMVYLLPCLDRFSRKLLDYLVWLKNEVEKIQDKNHLKPLGLIYWNTVNKTSALMHDVYGKITCFTKQITNGREALGCLTYT